MTASPVPPTARRAQILKFIRQYTQEHDTPPTLREITDAVGMRSTSGVHYHLKQMHMQELLRRNRSTSRR
ncbi:LexA family protein [Streptomyces polyrhachis]|uniref:LexA family protein n=1 Tax=Streptomyces polyrhachis TaxID=1282885 RepID=A0ABW2GLY5_9ACTN